MARNRHVKKEQIFDTLTGIERYPGSDACGELVCPFIFLWKKIGAAFQPDNLQGALPHGATVEIVETTQDNKGFAWCFVSGPDNGGGTQSGWLRQSMLLNAGAGEYGESN